MGSLNSPPPSIPTIDFSVPDLNPGTLNWEPVNSHVKKAIEDYGRFYAQFNSTNFDQGFQIEIFRLLKSLYDVPQERKIDGAEGFNAPYMYVPRRPQSGSPLYENFAIDDVSTVQSFDNFVDSLLPQGEPCSSKSLHSFKKEAIRLQEIIRKMIIECLGVEKYMEDHMSSVQYSLRMQKYEASKTAEAEIGLLPHKDTNTLTVLYQNQVSGLEVQTKDGDWIKITPPLCSFVVLMAQSLEAWANGRFHVPLHRVMVNAGNEDRYSIGIFSRPKDGYTVQAPGELVDEEHPLLYGPFDYSEFRKARDEYFRKGVLDMKAYCGLQHSSTA